MERKVSGGTVRNKERSKKKFLNAVGKILKNKGYASLKVNEIALVAGVDKKMIYTYFGGLDGLIDAYIQSQDFWSNVQKEHIPEYSDDGGKALSEFMLLSQYDFVSKHKELQKVLLWRLSVERKALRNLTDKQEMSGEQLFSQISDPYFGSSAEQFRAIMALMVAGSYYLNIYPQVNGSVFCGIDLKTEKGERLIKEAISFMVDQTYEKLKLTAVSPQASEDGKNHVNPRNQDGMETIPDGN